MVGNPVESGAIILFVHRMFPVVTKYLEMLHREPTWRRKDKLVLLSPETFGKEAHDSFIPGFLQIMKQTEGFKLFSSPIIIFGTLWQSSYSLLAELCVLLMAEDSTYLVIYQ